MTTPWKYSFCIEDQKQIDKLLRASLQSVSGVSSKHFQRNEMLRRYFDVVNEFVQSTFKAPMRYDYQALLRLTDTSFGEVIPKEAGDYVAQRDLLTVKLEYRYRTENKSGNKGVKLNGDGCVHRVVDTIPQDTWLAQKYEKGKIPEDDVRAWVLANFDPEVSITRHEAEEYLPANVMPSDISLSKTQGRLWIRFPIYADKKIEPEDEAYVRYRQKSLAEHVDKHHWLAFTTTVNFQFSQSGFTEHGYGIIPFIEPTLYSRDPGTAKILKPTVDKDRITAQGLVFPGAVFGYVWHPRRVEE